MVNSYNNQQVFAGRLNLAIRLSSYIFDGLTLS